MPVSTLQEGLYLHERRGSTADLSAQELERLVCGNPNLDFDALQQNTKYEGGYSPNTPVSDRPALICRASGINEAALLRYANNISLSGIMQTVLHNLGSSMAVGDSPRRAEPRGEEKIPQVLHRL